MLEGRQQQHRNPDIDKESLEIIELERLLAEKKKAREQIEKARGSFNFKESRIKNNTKQLKKAPGEMKRSGDDIDSKKRRAAETRDESAESSQSAKKKKISGFKKDSDKETNEEGKVSYDGKDRKRTKMKEKTETLLPKSPGKSGKEKTANHLKQISRTKNPLESNLKTNGRKEEKSSDLKADKIDSDRSQDNFQLHINLSSDNSLVGVEDDTESDNDNEIRNAEISSSEPVAGVTGEVRYHYEYEPPPPGMLPQEFIEENLLTQCGQNRNYDRDERRGYASNRNQASQQPAMRRPKMASLEVGRLPGDHSSLGPPLASSDTVWGAGGGDRTPERPGLDDTPPVWGSLEDSEEWNNPPPILGANSEIGTETCLQHTKNNLDKEQETPKSDTVDLSVNKSVDKSSDRDLNLSLEVERPPTPPLVAALQEEEGMEWESVDREEILRETNKARQLCRDIQVDDFMEEEHAEGEQQQEGRETGRDLVVVDTNVFISSLDVLTQLRDDTLVRVVVPWMVVRELDSLKAGAGGTAVRARAAVRWLNAALKADPARQRIMAQTAAECGRATAILQQEQRELSPDDRILATCLALTGHNSFLLTNDVNLANKALIHGVKCGDTEEIIHLINGNCVGQEARGTGDPEEERICAELTAEARGVATELLGECVRKEFEHAYGNLWHKIVSIKPKDTRPYWSLDNIFTLFSKHHIAVFGLSFPRNGRDLKSQMQSLKEKLGVKSKPKLRQVKLIISDMKSLFEMMKGKEHYETDIVEICVEKLANISSQLDNHENENIRRSVRNI